MIANSLPWRKIWRGALAVSCVALLVHLAHSKDTFSGVSKPAIIFILQTLGFAAADAGEVIKVGRLDVPWTRDCAGLNLVLILLALAFWINRNESLGWRFWGRLAIMVPCAVLANVARVLSLIAYRELLYPAVESPQLHYFLGFVWLLPFLTLIIPRNGRPMSHVLFEAMHAAVVVAMLTPMSGVPGGSNMTVAVVFCLTRCKIRRGNYYWLMYGTVAWLFAAAGITLVGMESLWIPWLLTCPLLVELSWLMSLPGIILTLASHPLFNMIPGADYILWAGLGLMIWQWLHPKPFTPVPEEKARIFAALPSRFRIGVATVCFCLPFLASTLITALQDTEVLPTEARIRPIQGGFHIALPDQPKELGLVWYSPQGSSRHHTVQVCLKYRGVEIEPEPSCAGVYTDGKHWLREFFIQDRTLIPEYLQYIKHTFRPWTSPGVHLIFITPEDKMSAQAFHDASGRWAQELHTLCEKAREANAEGVKKPLLANQDVIPADDVAPSTNLP